MLEEAVSIAYNSLNKFSVVKKTSEDEERKVDPTKYYSSSRQSSGQVAAQNGNFQKENKPVNSQGERMLGKSLNKEEKEEQLKNLLIDFQDLNKHKYKSDSQKQKIESDENENFEEDESNRVYARYLNWFFGNFINLF